MAHVVLVRASDLVPNDERSRMICSVGSVDRLGGGRRQRQGCHRFPHRDGFSRVLVHDELLTPRQAGCPYAASEPMRAAIDVTTALVEAQSGNADRSAHSGSPAGAALQRLHIGGVAPSWPTAIKPLSSMSGEVLGVAEMNTGAPGLTSAAVASPNFTIGVSGAILTFFSPPL